MKVISMLFICFFFIAGCGAITGMKAKSAMESFNNGDLKTYLKDWDDNATFVYPGGLAVSGEIKGKKAIEAWFRKWRETFPDVKFTVKDIYLKKNWYIGTENVMAVHWEAAGTNKFGERVGTSGVAVINISGTKIVRVQDYIFDADRLKEFWSEPGQ
ncbi:nuclear transport factor 2 family protein [Thermodesulfobacteriota bacterium]